ncbi:hypothetical protein [Phenylobacterium sp.]|uniref:hypothetical protein n=1 Tax=Phenylobacterium sp. TaxID=1871053 RepID=UPI0027300FF5|nr:hypothetical protein [Phenylobacterium sp.]MDP1598977.1 hypothetical protein [Phenylobacterium sp.]MDP3590404.1 hypothetical protein [Phenylobacterium sp.]
MSAEKIPTMPFRWDGEALVPMNPRAADYHYTIGQLYRITVEDERSAASHRHYFALVNAAWENLPYPLDQQYMSATALRKHALIVTGHRDEVTTVCRNRPEASRLAEFIAPIDEYALVVCSGRLVTRYTAKSQDIPSMGKEAFQKSKSDVLEYLAGLIGVELETLLKQREPRRVAA